MEVNIVVLKSNFELTGAFVGEYVNIWGFPMSFERVEDLLPCDGDACNLEIFDGTKWSEFVSKWYTIKMYSLP